MRAQPITVLFCAITIGLAGLAVAAFRGDQIVIAAVAAVLSAWMGWLAARTVRRGNRRVV